MIGAETARTWRLLRLLRGASGRSAAELEELRRAALLEAVRHAHERVPFYRRLWAEHGVAPLALSGLDDVRRLPVVSGSAVRAAARSGALLSTAVDAAALARYTTSGSAGEPLAVPRGPTEQRLWRAFGLRIWLEHGARLRDRTIRFDVQAGPSHVLQLLGVSRTSWVSSAEPAADQLARLRAGKARIAVGTPTSLRRLAAAALAGHTGGPGPGIVFAQGEVLDAATRRVVSDAFGVEPVSLYGLTELGYVAWQCERRDAFHVNAEGFLVELLRDGRAALPGETGALVVTDLLGRTMPLLRYDTGDLAVAAAGPCPCGRNLPVLAGIEGRAVDCLRLPDGRVVTPRAVLDALAPLAGPDDYRVRQDADGRVRIELAPGAPGEAVLAELGRLLGDAALAVEPLAADSEHGEKTRAVASASDCGRPQTAGSTSWPARNTFSGS